MRPLLSACLALILFGTALASGQRNLEKQSFPFEGRKRTFYLFVPDSIPADSALPLIVLLHGSGQDGPSLANPWRSLASKEGIILVAPDAAHRISWDAQDDHPDFIRELVEAAEEKHAVDTRRVYLFGHSNGGVYALTLALLESQYFAAVAVHAGAFCSPDAIYARCSREDTERTMEHARRKIPLGLWSGSFDSRIPLDQVERSQRELEMHGFPAELHVMGGATHDYYVHADEVNEAVWNFLRQHQLDSPPQFELYKR